MWYWLSSLFSFSNVPSWVQVLIKYEFQVFVKCLQNNNNKNNNNNNNKNNNLQTSRTRCSRWKSYIQNQNIWIFLPIRDGSHVIEPLLAVTSHWVVGSAHNVHYGTFKSQYCTSIIFCYKIISFTRCGRHLHILAGGVASLVVTLGHVHHQLLDANWKYFKISRLKSSFLHSTG